MNTCRTCGTEISPTGKRGRPAAFCSDACRPEAPVRVSNPEQAETIKVCTCETCGSEFDRPGSRGRLPKQCPKCKAIDKPHAVATVRATAASALAEFNVLTMRVGDLVKLISDDDFGTYKVMSMDLSKDGSVLLYGGHNFARRDSTGNYRMDVYAAFHSSLPCDVLGTIGHMSEVDG